MHLLILATGRTRDAHMLALEQEYARRLPAPWRYEVRELKASTATDQTTAKREEAATQLAALQALPPSTTVIALDERGQQHTSPGWSGKFAGWQSGGTRQVAFLIGGATGLAPDVLQACHARWALSTLTLPHQLVRVFLAEQLYRTHTLLAGHPYHRV